MLDVVLALTLIASLYVVAFAISYGVAIAWCYLDRQRDAKHYGVETALFEIDAVAESAWHRWEAEKVEEIDEH